MNDTRHTVVFLGPSIPLAAARGLLPDVDYRPPARQGDVYALLGTGVRRIVLLDGLFHGTPSVWQRELLAALDEGLEVIGACSMGALRAAELAAFGMIGRGGIFEDFHRGTFDGDDEVALLHGDADSGYRALSEPMVNLRATIARAVVEGVLRTDDASALVAKAKAMFYPRRSFESVCGDRELAARLRALRVDRKRADAEDVLAYVAALPPPAPPVPRAVPRDTHMASRARVRQVAPGVTGESLHVRAEERGVAARLYPDLARRWYALEWARSRGLACPPDVLAAFSEARRVDEAWLRARKVTAGEHASWLHDAALLAWMEAEGTTLDQAARAWLAEWGVHPIGPVLPDPDDLGFTWPRHIGLLVELLLGDEGRALVEVSDVA